MSQAHPANSPTGLWGPGPGEPAEKPDSEGMSRRTLIAMAAAAAVGLPWIGGGLAAIADFMGVPARAFTGAVIPDEVPAGLLADYKDNVPKPVMFGDETVYVIRRGSTAVALSGTCPHAGCLIGLPEKDPLNGAVPSQHFRCPCHGGTFDFSGKCVSGPPPRGMFQHSVKISMGRVIVGKKLDS